MNELRAKEKDGSLRDTLVPGRDERRGTTARGMPEVVM